MEGDGFEHEEVGQTPQEEFIEQSEVEQEIDAEGAEGADYGDDTIEIDMSNNSVTYFDKHTDSVFTVAAHPKLPLVVSGGGDNKAHLWTTHREPPREAGSVEHSESVIGAAFTADGRYLVTADMNGQVRVQVAARQGQEWRPAAELQEVDEVTWLKVHPHRAGIFAIGAVDGSVWCYEMDTQNNTPVLLMTGVAHAQDCTMGVFLETAADDENVILVTCSLDGTIIGWNCYSGQQVFKVTPSELKGQEAQWITLSTLPLGINRGSPIVACGSNSGLLAVINAAQGAVLHLTQTIELKEDQEEMDASIESIAFSSRMNFMVVGLVSGDILLYDTVTLKVRHKFVLPDSVTKLAFDKTTGFHLFASCIDGKVYEFDVRNGQQLHVCVGHNMGVLDFVLLEENRRLITAGDEGVSLVFQLPPL
ncbi:AGR242Cp [Eremothecium gossypii ATCC 10895]|uniref:AGR242Cp n=1 Tax=Eremothecium gossypii (strain ATCC 10895 / CBS 109.51 / FGSC 9923 / NRRL Y-1056) TaxID=284811 RepID=Q74ZG5_EREGS|nr:AGR242Cp [Eremothecium gossypii ATCC 10895]AAS54732.1 AGR242Cp [Eremothecium gossypii ATCC 10895]AEY99063.1 FAGR242Cp [Eremothecium gossypii FDAG1]